MQNDILTVCGNETPVYVILANLGLEPHVFSGKLLDVCCGKNAYLVKFFRARGLYADGLDIKLNENEKYLMRSNATSIQRSDMFYDCAVSHYGISVNWTRFTDEMAGELCQKWHIEKYRASVKDATIKSVGEVFRVLKPGGKFIMFPEPRFLLEEHGNEIGNLGFEISRQEVPESRILKSTKFDEYAYRSVLTKK